MDADGGRLLADVEVEKTADLARGVQLGRLFLEPTDAEHLGQQGQAALAVDGNGVAHDGVGSRVEVVSFGKSELARQQQPAHDLPASGLG